MHVLLPKSSVLLCRKHTQRNPVCRIGFAPEGELSMLSPFTLTVTMTPWGVKTIWRLWPPYSVLQRVGTQNGKNPSGNLNENDTWEEKTQGGEERKDTVYTCSSRLINTGRLWH